MKKIEQPSADMMDRARMLVGLSQRLNLPLSGPSDPELEAAVEAVRSEAPSLARMNVSQILLQALEAARHELTVMHGLMAFDGAAPQVTWPIDTRKVVALIDGALSQFANGANKVAVMGGPKG